MEGFGCENLAAAVGAAGGILHYVGQQLRRPVAHVRRIQTLHPGGDLLLDETTVANLEIVAHRGGAVAGVPVTLLGVLDATSTPMGARRLRQWLLRPLADLEGVRARHDAVEAFVRDRARLRAVRDALGRFRDLERQVARLAAGTGSARDLRALGASLEAVPALQRALEGIRAAVIEEAAGELHPLPELVARIARAVVDEPPASIRDGGLFRTGYHAELDTLRAAATEGRTWLAELQAREQARTGIKTLKVRHNKVFGYYIEIGRVHAERVPPDYERRQTLVNAER
ncbi:MAG: hypothetical protein KBH81_09675 [Phycisphaerae bacterium]|nr:hypothetical protein [Phycisphaerae bacterium]